MILRKRAEEILDLVKKTEGKITCSDNVILGDIYIGTGETDGVRLIAKVAGSLQTSYPGIHYHISSGNSIFVMERLDKGLLDFGLVSGTVDSAKYHTVKLPVKDVWGVLMRKDSPLASKEAISPEDLWDKPSLMMGEGLGYAISFDRIINTSGDANLCFRPLSPGLESEMSIIWKKYQLFSKPAEKFIAILKEQLSAVKQE